MTEVSTDRVREIVRKVHTLQDEVDLAKESVKAVLAAADGLGLRKDALKAAMRLRQLEPTKLKAWLDTFDLARLALGLDDQLDLEDAIKAANGEADASRPALEASSAVPLIEGPRRRGGRGRGARRPDLN